MALISPVFSYIGVATIVYATFKTLDFVYNQFLKPSALPKYLAVRSDINEAPWALITGSSDGVGKGLAIELAKKGFSIILHGRNEEKLAKLSAEIRQLNPNIKTRTLRVDASIPSTDLDSILKPVLEGIKITILINCIGGVLQVVPVIYKSVGDRTADEVDNLIAFNARFMTQITRLVLPKMTEPGLIINISSLTCHAMPWLTVYSAAKAYVNTFSTALNTELRGDGRDITVVSMKLGDVVGTPGNPDGGRAGSPDATGAAKAILARIGSRKSLLTAYWAHALSEVFLLLAPRSVLPGILINTVKELKDKETERLKKGI